MKKITILGSTGSIGKNALKVLSKFPDRYKVNGLTAGRNTALLIEQIRQFEPELVAVSDEHAYKRVKEQIRGSRPDVLCGAEGIETVAGSSDADIVLSAIVGSAGLLPTVAAIRAGKTVALANKETLVMAGDLIGRAVAEYGARLLPVDSEHSALFQCMRGYEKQSIRRLLLTASGGPFLGKTAETLEHVSPEDALKHPSWSMGRKVTIDSSTLMNKGLEVIEAHHLFGMAPEKIEVLVHPQSIVHSIVEFIDGSYLAQLSRPDMKSPIAFALSCPERLQDVIAPIDWEKLSGLTFQRPDHATFPCLSLAYSALEAGGTLPAVLNAANEVSVNAFLDRIIGFNAIPVIITRVMDSHKPEPAHDLDAILEADRWAREKTKEELKRQ